MKRPRVIIHYGHHEGTTGSHLAEAAERLGLGKSHPAAHGEHVRVADLGGEAYFWIESGVVSYPLDAHRSPVPTAGYLIDAHLHMKQSRLQAMLFDVVFMAQRDLIPEIRRVHPQVHWLPLAAPKQFLSIPRGDTYDAGFVGNLYTWTPRAKILAAISTRVRMNDYARKHSVEEMGRVYASSAVVINPAVAGDLNMRFFEGLGCGAVVVTPDVGNGLDEIAVRGRDFFVVNFDDPEIAAEEVARLVGSGVSGRAGREAIASGHTYDHRIREVLRVIEAAETVAPIRSYSRKERADLFCKLAATYDDSWLATEAIKQVRLPKDLSRHTASTFARVAAGKKIKAAVNHLSPRLASWPRGGDPTSGSDRKR